jgi:DNA-binding GntR family transcriptional regulator
MKNFFEFDRRKRTNVVDQVVSQFMSYVDDFKLIEGSPLPNLTLAQKELSLTDHELKQILALLTEKAYLRLDEKTKQYHVSRPEHHYDFIINVAPAYQEIINSGKKPAIFTLEKKDVTITPELASRFQGLTVGEKVTYYKRYFTADGKPMFFIEFCLSSQYLPNAKELFKDHEPHLAIMMQKFPLQYKFHVRELNVVNAPAYVQAVLDPKAKSLLCTYGQYRFFNTKGECVESGFAYMTDLTEFTTTTTDLSELLI